jgi:G:T-mismatch repair DNA endonuclease (very short patch repair protein)
MPKLARNQARDQKSNDAFTTEGWKSFVIWECETKHENNPHSCLKKFLGKAHNGCGRPKPQNERTIGAGAGRVNVDSATSD